MIVKTVKKYGNSGGVYLPSSWVGGEVEVKLIRRPAHPERDIPLFFSGQMKHIVSIFLFGSYVRGEQGRLSDIDVMIATDTHAKGGIKIPEMLKALNYDATIMSTEELRTAVKKDALLRKSLDSAKAVLNDSFLDELKSIKPDKGTLGKRIEFSESALRIIRGIYEKTGANPNLIYPILMRIKEMLLIRCIMEKKDYSIKKLLEGSLRRKGISRADYAGLLEHYRSVRSGKEPKKRDFREQVFGRLIELWEEMIRDARKKEKA